MTTITPPHTLTTEESATCRQAFDYALRMLLPEMRNRVAALPTAALADLLLSTELLAVEVAYQLAGRGEPAATIRQTPAVCRWCAATIEHTMPGGCGWYDQNRWWSCTARPGGVALGHEPITLDAPAVTPSAKEVAA